MAKPTNTTKIPTAEELDEAAKAEAAAAPSADGSATPDHSAIAQALVERVRKTRTHAELDALESEMVPVREALSEDFRTYVTEQVTHQRGVVTELENAPVIDTGVRRRFRAESSGSIVTATGARSYFRAGSIGNWLPAEAAALRAQGVALTPLDSTSDEQVARAAYAAKAMALASKGKPATAYDALSDADRAPWLALAQKYIAGG